MPTDLSTREAFDWAERIYVDGHPDLPANANETGGIAWGTAYLMQSYLTMFDATKDQIYLERFVRVGYAVLEARDVQRNLADYLGNVQPAWSAAGPYTACWRDIASPSGVPLVRLRCLAKGVPVVAETRRRGFGSGFDVTIYFDPVGSSQTFTDMSLDRRSPRYIVDILNSMSPTRTELTAIDLRSPDDTWSIIAPDRGPMTRYRYTFAVHTGIVAANLAAFAVKVESHVDLARSFSGPALEFLEAARAAVQVHDEDWVQYDDRTGVYIFPRNAPVRWDGSPLPHNQYLAMARAHAYLQSMTVDPQHADRARVMFSIFTSELGLESSPTWPYCWSRSAVYGGYGVSDDVSSYSPSVAPNRFAEDTGHGALDVECLALGNSMGLGPGDSEMSRIAQTFLDRIATKSPYGFATSRDSLSPGAGNSRHNNSVPRWAVLSKWNSEVLPFAKAVLDTQGLNVIKAETLASIATLVSQG